MKKSITSDLEQRNNQDLFFFFVLIWSVFALGKSSPCLDSRGEIPTEEQPAALRHMHPPAEGLSSRSGTDRLNFKAFQEQPA